MRTHLKRMFRYAFFESPFDGQFKRVFIARAEYLGLVTLLFAIIFIVFAVVVSV